jgi:hypothetical protein
MRPRGEANFNPMAMIWSFFCRISLDDATNKISKLKALHFQRRRFLVFNYKYIMKIDYLSLYNMYIMKIYDPRGDANLDSRAMIWTIM